MMAVNTEYEKAVLKVVWMVQTTDEVKGSDWVIS
jgi:hypothetical protein